VDGRVQGDRGVVRRAQKRPRAGRGVLGIRALESVRIAARGPLASSLDKCPGAVAVISLCLGLRRFGGLVQTLSASDVQKGSGAGTVALETFGISKALVSSSSCISKESGVEDVVSEGF